MKASRNNEIATTGTAIPMPTFAPVDRPLRFKLCVWLPDCASAEGCEDPRVAVGEPDELDPEADTEGLEELGELIGDELNAAPRMHIKLCS